MCESKTSWETSPQIPARMGIYPFSQGRGKFIRFSSPTEGPGVQLRSPLCSLAKTPGAFREIKPQPKVPPNPSLPPKSS